MYEWILHTKYCYNKKMITQKLLLHYKTWKECKSLSFYLHTLLFSYSLRCIARITFTVPLGRLGEFVIINKDWREAISGFFFINVGKLWDGYMTSLAYFGTGSVITHIDKLPGFIFFYTIADNKLASLNAKSSTLPREKLTLQCM